MIRSEKLYRYAAEFIEGELKAIDRRDSTNLYAT